MSTRSTVATSPASARDPGGSPTGTVIVRRSSGPSGGGHPREKGSTTCPPRPLEGLRRLAYNLYWTWHPEIRVLFSRIDPDGWARYRNPIPVLEGVRDWSGLLEDTNFLADYQTYLAGFDGYIANGAGHWFAKRHGGELGGPIAYFCAEYGLHESVGVYSGGLGVLAGDHCKTASDMALPLVAVGLLYRHGYFRQTIDADGHQEHAYPDHDPARLPLLRVVNGDGQSLVVPVELPGRSVVAAVWLAQVGRVPLLLLDTDVGENEPPDRPITHQLYVRGREMRLHQEIVLGVGGVRAPRRPRLPQGVNAVSQLHATTANSTWQGVPRSAILGITNGVHTPTWL